MNAGTAHVAGVPSEVAIGQKIFENPTEDSEWANARREEKSNKKNSSISRPSYLRTTWGGFDKSVWKSLDTVLFIDVICNAGLIFFFTRRCFCTNQVKLTIFRIRINKTRVNYIPSIVPKAD